MILFVGDKNGSNNNKYCIIIVVIYKRLVNILSRGYNVTMEILKPIVSIVRCCKKDTYTAV